MPYTSAQIQDHLATLIKQERAREYVDTDLVNVLEEMQSLLLEDVDDDYAELDEASLQELWDTALEACRERAYCNLTQPTLTP